MSATGAPLALELRGEEGTLALGGLLAAAVAGEAGPVLFALEGPLGSGKTTLARGLLRALGVTGPVRSPSYTLVEEYAASPWEILHLDLYRLTDPGELEGLAVRERHVPGTLILVEWPDRGAGVLPSADLAVSLSLGEASHAARLRPQSAAGTRILERFPQKLPDVVQLSP